MRKIKLFWCESAIFIQVLEQLKPLLAESFCCGMWSCGRYCDRKASHNKKGNGQLQVQRHFFSLTSVNLQRNSILHATPPPLLSSPIPHPNLQGIFLHIKHTHSEIHIYWHTNTRKTHTWTNPFFFWRVCPRFEGNNGACKPLGSRRDLHTHTIWRHTNTRKRTNTNA